MYSSKSLKVLCHIPSQRNTPHPRSTRLLAALRRPPDQSTPPGELSRVPLSEDDDREMIPDSDDEDCRSKVVQTPSACSTQPIVLETPPPPRPQTQLSTRRLYKPQTACQCPPPAHQPPSPPPPYKMHHAVLMIKNSSPAF